VLKTAGGDQGMVEFAEAWETLNSLLLKSQCLPTKEERQVAFDELWPLVQEMLLVSERMAEAWGLDRELLEAMKEFVKELEIKVH
jgi:hypothetical protein